VEKNGLGEVFDAPYDVVLDRHNVVQPDIVYVSKERASLIGESNIQGAPDLIIEILSESTAYRDAIQKKTLYARSGVQEYWMAAPDEKLIEVYTLKDREYTFAKIYRDDDILESQAIPSLRISLKDIFG
jgi:Uma2 family endonuclease